MVKHLKPGDGQILTTETPGKQRCHIHYSRHSAVTRAGQCNDLFCVLRDSRDRPMFDRERGGYDRDRGFDRYGDRDRDRGFNRDRDRGSSNVSIVCVERSPPPYLGCAVISAKVPYFSESKTRFFLNVV